MLKDKRTTFLLSIIFFILLFPFVRHDSQDIYNAMPVNDTSIGYYQSTTCNISLFEVYIENFNTENIRYNAHTYAGLECYGKVTGLDKVGDSFIVSIGVNPSISFIIQGLLWCSMLLFIKKSNNRIPKFSNLALLVVPLLIIFQHISESRFYSYENKYFNSDFSTNNYYLLIIFLTVYIFVMLLYYILETRVSNLINYIPYCFLLIGTFVGFNLNFYILMLVLLGFNNLIQVGSGFTFNKIYLFFTFFWLLSRYESYTFFDTDKIRGLVNSSNTISSKIYWIIVIGLVINGLYYLYQKSEINIPLLTRNLLISGSLMVVFGVMGATSTLINFMNYYFFGQNKIGMLSFESIAGNTWRGFSASAESAGEFYGFVVLSYFLSRFYKKIRFHFFDLPMLGVVIYGLYKTNNFASVSLLVIFIVTIIFYSKFASKISKRNLFISLTSFFIIFSILINNKYEYTYLSSELLYEASLHSNLYPNESNYIKTTKVTQLFDDGNLESLFDIQNPGKASSMLTSLVKIYTPNLGIPFVPNIVSVISATSILINRTEMWGIFISKYSPNLVETFFGNGPYQMNNYLYLQEIRLDLPQGRISSLFLPHSSLADLLVFGGIIGTMLIIFFTIRLFKENTQNQYFKFLILFLVINFLKSDSILYVGPVLLLFLSIVLTKKNEVINE